MVKRNLGRPQISSKLPFATSGLKANVLQVILVDSPMVMKIFDLHPLITNLRKSLIPNLTSKQYFLIPFSTSLDRNNHHYNPNPYYNNQYAAYGSQMYGYPMYPMQMTPEEMQVFS